MMSAKRLYLYVCVLLCITLLSVVLGYVHLKKYWFENPINFGDETRLDIVKGETLLQVLARLSTPEGEYDVYKNKLALRIFASDAVVKVGEYELSGAYSRDALLKFLASASAKQYRLTLIDGQTIDQMLLAAQDRFADASGFVFEPDSLAQTLSEHLDPRAVEAMGGARVLEGWFYPETYFFVKDSQPLELFLQSHRRLVDTLFAEWQGRAKDLPIDTPYEALILASIIERESGHQDERHKIAGVFTRRLTKGMKLQTDPTVIYGMGESYKGNITRKDLTTDTPFNTYTRYGLPPTPIANPGQASIHAVLHPAPGTALYFVAKGDGSHVFSDTLKQHNRAVRQFQINNRRANYRSAPLAK